MPACCVPGCKPYEKPLRRFPIAHLHVFDEWKRRVQSPIFSSVCDERIHQICYVCSLHFNEYNVNPVSDKLIYGSVPTLKVPGFSGPPTRENSFIYPHQVDMTIYRGNATDTDPATQDAQPETETSTDSATNGTQKENVTSNNAQPLRTIPSFTNLGNISASPKTTLPNHKLKRNVFSRDKPSNKSTQENDDGGSVIMDVIIKNEIESVDEIEIQYDGLFDPLRALFGDTQGEEIGVDQDERNDEEEDLPNYPAPVTDLEASLRFHNYSKPGLDINCRFCAKAMYRKKALEIFENPELENKIRFCYPFLCLSRHDGLPQTLCKDCVSNVDTIYKHFVRVKHNDVTLRGFVKTNQVTPAIENDLKFFENDPHRLCIQLVVERDEKFFSCPFCRKKFQNKKALKHHVLVHHVKENQQDLEDATNEENQTNSNVDDSTTLDDRNEYCVVDNANSNDDYVPIPLDTVDDNVNYTTTIETTCHQSQNDNNNSSKDPVTNAISSRTCKQCGKVFRTVIRLLNHERKSHRQKVTCYRCSLCFAAFFSTDKLIDHSASIHEITLETEGLEKLLVDCLYQCHHCSSLFTKPSSMEPHRSSCKMALDGLYQCFCSKIYKTYKTLRVHLLSHKLSSDYVLQRPACKLYTYCEHCKKHVIGLRAHMINSHPMEMEKKRKYVRNPNRKIKIHKARENITEESTPLENDTLLDCEMSAKELLSMFT